ncbi:hypothetical protein D3C75_453940 [compost metagenome]
MIQPVQGGELVTYGMGGPVLGHAAPDEAVEGQAGGPHQVGPHLVVGGLRQRPRAVVHQHLQQALRQPVLHIPSHREGEVLLQDVDEGIHHAVAHLARRQAVGGGGIQHRKPGQHQRVVEGELGLPPAHHGGRIALGSSGWQGQHAAERQGRLDRCLVQQDLPGVLPLEAGRRRHELGAIHYGSAAHRQQEVDALALDQSHRLHQLIVLRVGTYTGKLQPLPSRQRLGQLLIDTVLLDAAAAVEHQQAAACRDKLRQCGDLALPETDASRIGILEVVHGRALD